MRGGRLGVERGHPLEQLVDAGRVGDGDRRERFIDPEALDAEARQDQNGSRDHDERERRRAAGTMVRRGGSRAARA
jgi:hypothetical protein